MEDTKGLIKEVGVTDVPCIEEGQDKLDITKYVEGLEKFIRKCPTPMSIAIQGDWGTGKTSTINMLKSRLEKDGVIKCVYFNTWQYSQFSMSDDLYVSFVNALVRKCCTKDSTAKDILGIVQKMGTKLAMNAVKDNTGLDIEEFFKKQEEKMESVEKLKSKFERMIADEVDGNANGRVVIFIDDLDRLNPEVAVELLEVIKLFMDVKNCIFVLAIDYEVVVSGVRSKYGQNVSEEKCRSFFDKIIQLPFRLPVESYSLEGLIRETVTDDILEEDIEPLTEFVSDLLGANPRAYKRLANSFYLIKSVNEALDKEGDQQLDNVLIFSSLCIQMCISKLYQIIVGVPDEKVFKEFRKINSEELFEKYIVSSKLDLELHEKEKKIIFRFLVKYLEFLTEVEKSHKNVKDFYTRFTSVLQMTAITSVTAAGEQKERKAAIKVNKIVINGAEQNVSTPTIAIIECYKKILGDDLDLIKEYMEAEPRMLTDDETRLDAFFRNRREFCDKDGQKIFIGLSSSTNDKMRFTGKLCQFAKSRGIEAHIIWKDKDKVIFDSEKI